MLVSAVDAWLLVVTGCRSWNDATNMLSMTGLGQSVAARNGAMGVNLFAC